jgi:hypothetical protein
MENGVKNIGVEDGGGGEEFWKKATEWVREAHVHGRRMLDSRNVNRRCASSQAVEAR